MANIVLVGLEQTPFADQIYSVLSDGHRIKHCPEEMLIQDLGNADIVFASGESTRYLPLLKRVRDSQPQLPFVVVTRVPEIKDWLDALEAGATDYCAEPVEPRHLHWLMESTLPRFLNWPRPRG